MTKTIFIIFSRGIVARNILRSKIFEMLKDKPELQIVIFVPQNIPDYFRQECAHPRITLEESGEVEYGIFRRKIFEVLLQNLVFTKTSRFMHKFGGRLWRNNPSKLHYLLMNAYGTVASRIPVLKRFFRFLEDQLYPDFYFDAYFKKYKPNLVFVTTIMSRRDIAMAKAARRNGVKVIGMTRGWDNLDRLFMPYPPDLLFVQNDIMKNVSITWQAIPESKIQVVGFPQFDIYSDKSIYEERETFLRELGLDPARKVILYGSEGQWAPNDEHIVRLIYKMIARDELAAPCSLIIRPHFSDAYLKRFDEFRGKPHVLIDDQFRLSKFFTDQWYPEPEEMKRLANELKHMDILITLISTLALEAAIFDKPTINIDFYADTEPDRGPYFGRWYKATHYERVVETGAVRLAKSEEQLKKFLNDYLLHPEKDHAGRVQLVKTHCGPLDGQVGRRIGAMLLREIDSAKLSQ